MGSTTTEAVLTTEVTEITPTLLPESYRAPTEIMQEYLTKNETRNVDTPIFPTSTEDNLNAEVIGTTTTTSSPESSQTTTELIQEILTSMSPSEVIPITNTVESTEGNTEDFGIQSTFTNTVIVEETTEIEAEMTSTFDNTATTEETNSTTE